MNQLDIIISGIDRAEAEITLKTDYTEEKDTLDQIYSDLCVMRRLGAPLWKVNDAKTRIRQIKKWIAAEEATK